MENLILEIVDGVIAVVFLVLAFHHLASSTREAPINLRTAWVLEGVGGFSVIAALIGTPILMIGNVIMIGGIALQVIVDRRHKWKTRREVENGTRAIARCDGEHFHARQVDD